MTLSWLRTSLATWRGKLKWRTARLKRIRAAAHAGSGVVTDQEAANIKKWERLVDEAKAKIAKRNREIVSKQRANRKAALAATGVTKYDGVPVAAWMVPYLQWARQNGWNGRLVSGWRDPQYSRQLCLRMCGAPSCPGRCAGTSSNHVGSAKPHGAVDVSDYATFERVMARCPYEPKLINRLDARDPVHFSASGV